MKHNYVSRMTAVALALVLVLMPTASFAANNTRGEDGRNGFFGWFGASSAKAQVTTTHNRAPSISGVTAPTVLTVGTEGTWSVNASDPENGSLSYKVDWGDEGLLRLFKSTAEAFVQTSTFTHTYEKSGIYTAHFTVKDDTGRTSSSSVTVRVVKGEAEELSISDVKASVLNETHAAVWWKTNLRSDSTVFYSTTSPVDEETALSVHKRAGQRDHRIMLRDLEPGTTYYYIVRSMTHGGDTIVSDEGSFATPSSGDGPPVIKDFTGPAELTVDEEGTWTVNASDPENESLSYAIKWGDEGMMSRLFAAVVPAFVQTSTFTHTYATAGTYEIEVTVQDADGNEAVKTTSVTVLEGENLLPVISNIGNVITGTSIALTWDTAVEADSKVFYSTTSPVVVGGAGTTSVINDMLSTSHSVTIDGLASSTQYFFLLESEDADGDVSTATEFSLTTE